MVIRFFKEVSEKKRREKLRQSLINATKFNVSEFFNSSYEGDKGREWQQKLAADDSWKSTFQTLKYLSTSYERLLDVGCGVYELIAIRNNETAVGVDCSSVALRQLLEGGFKGHVITADVLHLPFRNRSFDCVISDQVIEHMLEMNDVDIMINEMRRVAKGRIIVETPNCAYQRKILDPTHFWFFTTRTLKGIMPEFEFYAVNNQYSKTLQFYLMYDNPKIRKIPIFGSVFIGIMRKIDESKILKRLNKILWRGNSLAAIKG